MEDNGNELLPVVDESGNTIGKISRREAHNGTKTLHPVVHLHVFNTAGDIYLQKRSENKLIQPGKWDTSVGGHISYNESILDALRREASEELGITDFSPVFLYSYLFESDREYEYINVFYTIYDGIITPDYAEVSEGKYWSIDDIKTNTGKDILTPNFEKEITGVIEFLSSNK